MVLYRDVPLDANRSRSVLEDSIETDELGRYAVGDLSVGDHYNFRVAPGDGSVDLDWAYHYPSIQEVRPGMAGFVRLPDVRLVDRDQELSGIAEAPDGRPVAGVQVSARVADGPYLSRRETGPPPWTETDARGRFALHQLPDLPIELMVYRANPRGGPILHPATSRPARDQDDVRIVFDPALTVPPEDLDAPGRSAFAP